MYIHFDDCQIRQLEHDTILVEDAYSNELFRFYTAELPERFAQRIIGLMNTSYRQGVQQGRRELSKEMRRLLGAESIAPGIL